LCRFASQNGIWYNARGSAAGSIVAYTLDITNVEPIAHGLIFERFLNPGRISMPDIDLDFQDDQRARMMEYCARKYGSDRVAQIITFGTLGARAAVRDVGRVMDIPLSEVDRVSKLIPNVPGKPVSISEALEQVPELKSLYDNTPYLKDLIDTAAHMEGSVRSAGTHAAGVIITDKPCVLIKREGIFRRGAILAVDAEKCTGCRTCLRVGCPAIEWRPGEGKRGQSWIDPALCNGCDVCRQLCQFEAIGVAQ
jgi:DNA polymerase-3 subunit alpha